MTPVPPGPSAQRGSVTGDLPRPPSPTPTLSASNPFLRSPHQLTQRLLHALSQHGLIVGRPRDRYGLLRRFLLRSADVVWRSVDLRSGPWTAIPRCRLRPTSTSPIAIRPRGSCWSGCSPASPRGGIAARRSRCGEQARLRAPQVNVAPDPAELSAQFGLHGLQLVARRPLLSNRTVKRASRRWITGSRSDQARSHNAAL